MIRKNLRLIISLSITIAFIIYIYVNRHSIFGPFAHMNYMYLIPIFAGQLGIQISNAFLLKITTKPLAVKLGYMEAFKLTMISSFVNFFTPVVGGASTRAVYLKREHGLSYSSFIGVIYANYLIIFIVSFLAGLFALSTLSGAFSVDSGKVVAVFFTVGALSSIFFILFGHLFTSKLKNITVKNRLINGISKKLSLIDDGWGLIRKEKKVLLFMTLCSLATTVSVTVLYWGAMKSIGLNSLISIAVVYSALAIVGLLINITPGSLGIREAVYASIYTLTAIGAQKVVAFSLIDRMTQLLLLGLGWILFNHAIIKGIGRKAEITH